MRLLRERAAPGQADDPLAALRACPPGQDACLRLWADGRRGLARVSATLRASARDNGCHLALAETGGIGSRWLDGIACGPSTDLVRFVEAVAPLLDRAHVHYTVAPAA